MSTRMSSCIITLGSLLLGCDIAAISGALLFMRDVVVLPAMPRQLSNTRAVICGRARTPVSLHKSSNPASFHLFGAGGGTRHLIVQ